MANVVQSAEEVVSKLPRAPATCGIVKVRLHGSKKSERDFKVRRVKVLEALLWLQANNPLYEDIRIDEEVLSSLPDDGQPRELRPCDEDHVPADASDAELSDESDNEFEPVDEGPQEASRARSQGGKPVFDREPGVITGMSVANERRMAAAHVKSAQEPADRSAGSAKRRKLATMHEEGDSGSEENAPMEFPKREGIVDEFNSPGYLALAFPHLFPYGVGDVTQERLGEDIPWKDYFKHLMRYCDSAQLYRFQSDLRFRYFAFNTLQRHRAMPISRAFIRLGELPMTCNSLSE